MKRMSMKLMTAIALVTIGVSSNIYAGVLHQIREEQVITKGATHINDKLLMNDGWRNVNVLKVYLDEPNIAIRPIESSTGVTRKSVLDMVTESGAIAGVNADYFDMGTSSTPSLGTFIKDGEIKHAYNTNYSSLGANKHMATFLLDTNNTPLMSYYGVSIKLSANGEFVGAASSKNNIPGSITRPIIVDDAYRQNTNSIVAAHKTVYTIVVENGKVTYRSKQGEGVTIPQDGYVVILPQALANEYYKKMPIGADVELEEYLYLNDQITHTIDKLKLGIGGSGIIMRDGNAYTGSAHKVTPNSAVARTVVATTKDSNAVLLLTVDYKGSYKGATHTQLIEILKRYNVKDAMYLDGGGSTTFVARNEGAFSPTLQNSPTGGAQRKVVNALGVFSTSQTGNVAKIEIEPNTDRTFVGENVSFKFKATDENNNPVQVNTAEVTFSVVGGSGNFNNSSFVPTSTGNMLIVANYKGIESATEIAVTDVPKGLVIEPSLLQVNEGETKKVQIYAVDKLGYKIPINASNVTWSNDNSNIGASGNKITGNAKTTATLTANYKGITKSMGVVVGNTSLPVESFENTTATWNGDTSSVTGKVEVSKELKYHGNQSIKMAYTFMPSPNRQIAYTQFTTPINIPSDASSINMWLNARDQGHIAKIEVVDSTGQKYFLKLSDNLNFTGWKYVTTQIPADMVLPAKVTKLYAYSNSNKEKISTALYIDHVSVTRGITKKAGVTVRDDRNADPSYREVMQGTINNQYILNAVGPTKVNSMMMSSDTLKSIGNQLSSGPVIMTSRSNNPVSISSPMYNYKNTYETINYNNTTVVMLGTESGGIRTTEAAGWTNLKNTLQKTGSDHIILVMSRNPLTQFNDSLEGKVLHDYLADFKEETGKNIFVVTPGGYENEVYLEDGIRYIRTHGVNVLSDNYKEGSFLKFKVDGKSIYYTFEKFK